MTNSNTVLSALRKKARKDYDSSSIPKLKYGLGIQNMADQFLIDLDKMITPEVIIKGKGKYVLSKISDGAKQFKNFHSDNKFALANLASTDGIIITIPDFEEVELEITTIFEQEGASRIIIYAGKSTTCHISHKISSFDECKLQNFMLEIFLEENSNLNYSEIQNSSTKTNCVTFRSADVASSSDIKWVDGIIGGNFVISNTNSNLLGENANSNLLGFFVGTKKQKYDIGMSTYHKSPNTNSNIFARGVVKENAYALHRGFTEIAENANNSNGAQREEILMLDSTAKADSIPELKIDTNDVKCSHAASVGRIDYEKLFYLQSRGLDKEEAEKVIVTGFLEPLINLLPAADIKSIKKMIKGKIYGSSTF